MNSFDGSCELLHHSVSNSGKRVEQRDSVSNMSVESAEDFSRENAFSLEVEFLGFVC